MTLNMNVGDVRYSPARDVAYLWPSLLAAVADRLEDGPHPVLHRWLKKQGVTLDDLGAAAKAYCTYVNLCHKELDFSMVECLEASGWNKVKPEAQVAYLFYAGALLSGMFFVGIRDAIPEDSDQPHPGIDQLHQAARQFEAYVSMTWWQRTWYKWSKLYRRLFLRYKAVRRPV